jgi:hypothetical protein
MLDDLRNSVSSEFSEETVPEEIQPEAKPRKIRGPLFGMTAVQRFIIAVFLFLMVTIIGIFLLIMFQKVYPPI